MKRVMLFGGSFDPIHNSHTAMVQKILDLKLVQEVWYVPVKQHTKNFENLKNMSAPEHRVKMLELVLDDQTKVETCELESGQPSYTASTLRFLQTKYPDNRFSWLIGSDQLPKLDLWIQADGSPTFPQILTEFDFYVYPRLDYPMDLPYPQLKPITGVEPLPDSSTQIRDFVHRGKSISHLVDPRVEAYILEHQLYLK